MKKKNLVKKKSILKSWALSGGILVLSALLLTGCKDSAGATKQPGKRQEQIEEQPPELNNLDPVVAEFVLPYINHYYQKEDAFITIGFEDRGFLPEDVWEKIDVLESTEIKEDPIGYYVIINLEDQVEHFVEHWDHVMDEYILIDTLTPNAGEMYAVAMYETTDIIPIVTATKAQDFVSEFYPTKLDDPYSEAVLVDGIVVGVNFWIREVDDHYLVEDLDVSEAEGIVYKEGDVDLNGDGQTEYIAFTSDTFNYYDQSSEAYVEKGYLQIDDQSFDLEQYIPKEFLEYEEEEGPAYIYNAYVMDMDPEDQYKEIFVGATIMDITSYQGLRYDGQNLIDIGVFEADYGLSFEGMFDQETKQIRATNMEYGICGYSWDQMYELKGDKIVKIEQKSYNINNFRRRIVAAVVQPLNLYEKADSKEPMQVLEPGDRILFMETNIKDWIKVKNFDAGKTGYLRLVGGDDYQMVFYQQEDLYPRDMLANLPDWG